MKPRFKVLIETFLAVIKVSLNPVVFQIMLRNLVSKPLVMCSENIFHPDIFPGTVVSPLPSKCILQLRSNQSKLVISKLGRSVTMNTWMCIITKTIGILKMILICSQLEIHDQNTCWMGVRH